MITPEVKESIIEVLGGRYLTKIMKYAEEVDFRKSDGEFYSKHSFSRVLNGREDPKIEDFILESAKHYKKLNDARQRKMKEFAESVQKTA